MILLSRLEFVLKIVQHAVRYCIMFCGVISMLVNICHPFLEGFVFTTTPPEYDCPICRYCPVNNTFMANHLYLPFIYAPLHITDLLLSVTIIYIVYVVKTEDNRPCVISNLLFTASIKLFVMGVQTIEMAHTGAGNTIELVLSMEMDHCRLTQEQVIPAYWMILRVWFFVINVISTILLTLLILGNKMLARWYHPLEDEDCKLLVEGDDDEYETLSPLEGLGIVPYF